MRACGAWRTLERRWQCRRRRVGAAARVPAMLFGVIAFTDFLDGFLARRWQVESALGAFLDPVADKFVVCTTFVLLSGALGATEDDGLTEAMEHATRLVDNMRRLYVSESTPPGPFEVADVAHRLEPMLRLAAKPARFSMRRAGIGSIFGASWRLERILLNLVLNASEAADDGRVEVEVVTDTDVIRIDVDDDGPGFRERPGQDDDLRGKGLTVVRRQVALLAGEVALSTSPIGGARVTLTFPRSD